MSILIVEDNAASARVLRVNLARYHGEVILAENGRGAVEALASRPDIELVITDIMMPEMDGLGLIAQMRANPDWRDIPVIVASAVADADRVKQAARLGIHHFFVKPIDVPQLLQKVRETLARDQPVLVDKPAMMTRLQIDDETYNELLTAFSETVDGTIALLQETLGSAADEGHLTSLRNAMSGISETAALLGATQVARAAEEVKEERGREALLARCRLLLRDLSRLRRALPATPGVAVVAGSAS